MYILSCDVTLLVRCFNRSGCSKARMCCPEEEIPMPASSSPAPSPSVPSMSWQFQVGGHSCPRTKPRPHQTSQPVLLAAGGGAAPFAAAQMQIAENSRNAANAPLAQHGRIPWTRKGGARTARGERDIGMQETEKSEESVRPAAPQTATHKQALLTRVWKCERAAAGAAAGRVNQLAVRLGQWARPSRRAWQSEAIARRALPLRAS